MIPTNTTKLITQVLLRDLELGEEFSFSKRHLYYYTMYILRMRNQSASHVISHEDLGWGPGLILLSGGVTKNGRSSRQS